jgi:hypothetical protein
MADVLCCMTCARIQKGKGDSQDGQDGSRIYMKTAFDAVTQLVTQCHLKVPYASAQVQHSLNIQELRRALSCETNVVFAGLEKKEYDKYSRRRRTLVIRLKALAIWSQRLIRTTCYVVWNVCLQYPVVLPSQDPERKSGAKAKISMRPS